MSATGKTIQLNYQGRQLTLCNQRSRDWTCPYGYQDRDSTLSHAGCGIFSVVHVSEWLTDVFHDPDELARFSLLHGGRDDDGTNRPELLKAMMETGLNREFGFTYRMDGNRNELSVLYQHLLQGNAAMCNLRVGHIVALWAARDKDGTLQVLAADPYSESADSRVMDHVCEVVPESEIVTDILGRNGLKVGELTSYALFWAELSIVRDFNLLYRL